MGATPSLNQRHTIGWKRRQPPSNREILCVCVVCVVRRTHFHGSDLIELYHYQQQHSQQQNWSSITM